MFIKYEAEVSSGVSGGERGVVDFGKLFTEINEQKIGVSLFCYPIISKNSARRHPRDRRFELSPVSTIELTSR